MSLVGLALRVAGRAQGLVHEPAHRSGDLLDLARRTEGLAQLLELLQELPVARELCLDGGAPVRERMALGQLRLGLVDVLRRGKLLGPREAAVGAVAGLEHAPRTDAVALDPERQVGLEPDRQTGATGVGSLKPSPAPSAFTMTMVAFANAVAGTAQTSAAASRCTRFITSPRCERPTRPA